MPPRDHAEMLGGEGGGFAVQAQSQSATFFPAWVAMNTYLAASCTCSNPLCQDPHNTGQHHVCNKMKKSVSDFGFFSTEEIASPPPPTFYAAESHAVERQKAETTSSPHAPEARAAGIIIGKNLSDAEATGSRIHEINSWHTIHDRVSQLPQMNPRGLTVLLHMRTLNFELSTRSFQEQSSLPQAVPVPPATSSMLNSRTLKGAPPKKAKCFAWAITEIRVVRGSGFPGGEHAEYLVVGCFGKKLFCMWKRFTAFTILQEVARRSGMHNTNRVWDDIHRAKRAAPRRPFSRNLRPEYLQNKGHCLERFLREFMFEATSLKDLLAFFDGEESLVEL